VILAFVLTIILITPFPFSVFQFKIYTFTIHDVSSQSTILIFISMIFVLTLPMTSYFQKHGITHFERKVLLSWKSLLDAILLRKE
jgi:hypothetical protein